MKEDKVSYAKELRAEEGWATVVKGKIRQNRKPEEVNKQKEKKKEEEENEEKDDKGEAKEKREEEEEENEENEENEDDGGEAERLCVAVLDALKRAEQRRST